MCCTCVADGKGQSTSQIVSVCAYFYIKFFVSNLHLIVGTLNEHIVNGYIIIGLCAFEVCN